MRSNVHLNSQAQSSDVMEPLTYDVVLLARNAEVAVSLLYAVCLAVIKRVSGCVRIACHSLVITCLLQVLNRLDAS